MRESDSHRTYLPILSPPASIDPFNMHSFVSSLTHCACVLHVNMLRVVALLVVIEGALTIESV